MSTSRDTILLETVRTHRARLLSAFLYGELAERRLGQDNLKRLLGSVVLAAVICTGCVGFALVTSLIASQAAQQAQQRSLAGQRPASVISRTWLTTSTAAGSGAGAPLSLAAAGRPGATRRITPSAAASGSWNVPPAESRSAFLNGTSRETADVTTTVEMSELGSTLLVVGRKVKARCLPCGARAHYWSGSLGNPYLQAGRRKRAAVQHSQPDRQVPKGRGDQDQDAGLRCQPDRDPRQGLAGCRDGADGVGGDGAGRI